MKHLYLLAACYLLLQEAGAQNLAYTSIGTTVAGGNGSGTAAGQLNRPGGIVVDAAGSLWVADTYNHRIQKWASGAISGVTMAGGNGPGNRADQLNMPSDLRLDAAGNLYVADAQNHRIQKFAPGSAMGVTVAGGNGAGAAANQLDMPAGLALDAAGNIYIADYNNSRIQKWAPGAAAGVNAVQIDPFTDPNDVFIDAAGNLYVVLSRWNGVLKFVPGSSSGIGVAGGIRGSGPNEMAFPTGAVPDGAGNVFVADFYNNRIQKWGPESRVIGTVAGGNGNGIAPDQFSNPINLALAAGGDLYVSDFLNHRVQKFSLARVCPENIILPAASCSGTTTLRWTPPTDGFPENISIPSYLDPSSGQLTSMGSLNGHGYYRSSRQYSWSDARYIAEFIGDTGVSGHLATVTSAAENTFVTNLVGGRGLYFWIGLYSTGKPGNFRWITDEPLTVTNWASSEPNNFVGNPAIVAEPHVHLYPSGEWNDQKRISLFFIAEFDKPLIQYRQVSGVSNGSQQNPGVYMICYERTNRITGTKDSCCFSVTIQCPAAGSTTGSQAQNALVPVKGNRAAEGALQAINPVSLPSSAQKKSVKTGK